MTSLLLRSLATMAFYLGTLSAARGQSAWFLWWVPLAGLGVLLVRWFGWSALVDLVMGIGFAQPVALTMLLVLLWRRGNAAERFDATLRRAVHRYPVAFPRLIGGWIIGLETYLRLDTDNTQE